MQPQLVAVKSLIEIASISFFMVYCMHPGLSMFPDDFEFTMLLLQYIDKILALISVCSKIEGRGLGTGVRKG